MSLLDDLVQRLGSMDPKTKSELLKETNKLFGQMRWIPNIGRQADAYYNQADILGYGGAGGGGKSDLILGLAFTQHKKSLILRRHYTDLSALTERAIQINGSRKGYSGATPPSLRTNDGRLIEFGAAAIPGDEESWQGRPHDLLAIDEATHFLESQIRYLMGWVRTTEKNQRVRVILATNPPMTAEGQWFFEFFRPWVDKKHPKPARPGELRWYVTDENGKDCEVDGPEPVSVGTRLLRPMSRTFIPASLKDNPFLSETDYQAKLDALQEPLRSAIRDGNFGAARRDDLWQLIPSQWILDAQKRWTPKPPDNVPMCCVGVDVAQGGADETVLAMRYDGWYAPMVAVPGVQTPFGSDVAALVIKHRRNQCEVVIDLGGGYGGAARERLIDNGVSVRGFKGSNTDTTARTKDRQYGFTNKRSEAWWKFREALDPDQEGGSPISLPDDNALFADLVAPTFEVVSKGIKMEPKEELVTRLGRSTDRGDAVVMAWTHGGKTPTHGQQWREMIRTKFSPTIVMGHDKQRRRFAR